MLGPRRPKEIANVPAEAGMVQLKAALFESLENQRSNLPSSSTSGGVPGFASGTPGVPGDSSSSSFNALSGDQEDTTHGRPRKRQRLLPGTRVLDLNDTRERNPGIEARIARDQAAATQGFSTEQERLAELEDRARLYDLLAAGRAVDSRQRFLVDYEAKALAQAQAPGSFDNRRNGGDSDSHDGSGDGERGFGLESGPFASKDGAIPQLDADLLVLDASRRRLQWGHAGSSNLHSQSQSRGLLQLLKPETGDGVSQQSSEQSNSSAAVGTNSGPTLAQRIMAARDRVRAHHRDPTVSTSSVTPSSSLSSSSSSSSSSSAASCSAPPVATSSTTSPETTAAPSTLETALREGLNQAYTEALGAVNASRNALLAQQHHSGLSVPVSVPVPALGSSGVSGSSPSSHSAAENGVSLEALRYRGPDLQRTTHGDDAGAQIAPPSILLGTGSGCSGVGSGGGSARSGAARVSGSVSSSSSSFSYSSSTHSSSSSRSPHDSRARPGASEHPWGGASSAAASASVSHPSWAISAAPAASASTTAVPVPPQQHQQPHRQHHQHHPHPQYPHHPQYPPHHTQYPHPHAHSHPQPHPHQQPYSQPQHPQAHPQAHNPIPIPPSPVEAYRAQLLRYYWDHYQGMARLGYRVPSSAEIQAMVDHQVSRWGAQPGYTRAGPAPAPYPGGGAGGVPLGAANHPHSPHHHHQHHPHHGPVGHTAPAVSSFASPPASMASNTASGDSEDQRLAAEVQQFLNELPEAVAAGGSGSVRP